MIAALMAAALSPSCSEGQRHTLSLSAADARVLAKEAVIYGFPIVDNYRIQYSYFVDRTNPEYKAPYNHLFNIPRVYTPEDRAIQTPNSDTPYSWIGLDLRAEPIVFTVPPIDKTRYWSLQLIDLYTFNFDYLGSRTTGNDGGSFAVAGPNWHGELPPGIKKVIRAETETASAQFRTQLFEPGDLENVKKVQAQYIVQPLSAFLGQNPPPVPAALQYPKPLAADDRTSLEFFGLLNWLLQFCPVHPSEVALRERFARLGIVAGKEFDSQHLAPEVRTAIEAGMKDAWTALAEFKAAEIDTGKLTAADGFGTRDYLKNDYMRRMASAAFGIYGNSKEEALYPAYFVDADGQKLVGAHRYRLRFGPGQLPPVNSFWSLTLYELPASLLYSNRLNRYLINSAMLPGLKKDPDGGITLSVQHESPGQRAETNWLPSPSGPFWITLRLYWPKAGALDGQWKQPALQRLD
jgi:hypothetical protein